ncbi:MAG TPA: POT family MFS transporter [Planctomycetaceae bacterium]|nr:POT family MFS transporter [Planctomycetaceae bacterium]
MPKTPYLTAPVPSTKMPGGIPYIIGNEAAERFSFYGMRTILVTFMTKFLLDASGKLDPMGETDAKSYYHLFVMGAYFFPLFGAVLSDIWLGKYRTILALSVVYCLGHLALAVDETRVGLFLGLILVALGTGGIKPCVSAHVSDQFGRTNVHLQTAVFGWFYIAINFGSSISSMLTPWLLEELPGWLGERFSEASLAFLGPLDRIGPHVAFGVPGVLMVVATWVFWLGRHKFVHIPPRGAAEVLSLLKGEGGQALLRLIPIYLFVAVFWSLYDQTGAAWVLQARQMDRHWLGIEWLESQIQVINPILILIYVPLFTYVIYPGLNRLFTLTPLRKVSIGFFLAAAAFAITAIAQQRIDRGETTTIEWQLVAYEVLTAAEVMVSVTCLEFSYTQAPREMKSIIMSFYLLSVSAGNLLTALVNYFSKRSDGTMRLEGAAYYWFFTGLMFVASILFIVVASAYREKTYIQEEQPIA